MASTFNLPELGENIESGDVVHVLIATGDTVAKDQPVLEMETGKATVEVPSSVDGKVTKLLAKEGESLAVGAPVFEYEPAESGKAEGEGAEGKKAEAEPKKGAKAKSSEKTAKSDESDGSDSPAAAKRLREAGSEPPPKEPAPKPPADAPKAKPGDEAPQRTEAPAAGASGLPIPAAPSVRRFAREVGVDLAAVTGSGPGGRISVDDVKAHLKSGGAGAASGPASAKLPDFSRYGEIEAVPMSAIRKATARQMSLAWSQVPHVTQHDLADITDVETFRKAYAKRVEARGGKLTVTAILLKVVAAALKVFPQFNASVDMAGQKVLLKTFVNLGVAVATPKGLVVPVIRDADGKGIADLAAELAEISAQARDGKLSPDAMQGGTFTVTNLGGIGGTHFTPIVNWPEVAILGVGRGAVQPVWRDGEFEARTLLPLSLSYDHRVIDGADGAAFIRWISEALQEPLLISLEG